MLRRHARTSNPPYANSTPARAIYLTHSICEERHRENISTMWVLPKSPLQKMTRVAKNPLDNYRACRRCRRFWHSVDGSSVSLLWCWWWARAVVIMGDGGGMGLWEWGGYTSIPLRACLSIGVIVLIAALFGQSAASGWRFRAAPFNVNRQMIHEGYTV